MKTPSSRSGASARPIARCSAGSSPRLERQLHRGHVGVGVGELERHERAVVEAAPRRRRPCRSRPCRAARDARGERRLARRRPGDLIRLGRKAVIVVEHRRARRRSSPSAPALPSAPRPPAAPAAAVLVVRAPTAGTRSTRRLRRAGAPSRQMAMDRRHAGRRRREDDRQP